jgi:hypothetical protein
MLDIKSVSYEPRSDDTAGGFRFSDSIRPDMVVMRAPTLDA